MVQITTNGLFDPTAVPLVGDYLDSAVISLDGVESTHDFNRRRVDGGGTYSAISENIRRLSRYPVELSLRTCVTSRSVSSMTTIASHFCSEFEFDLLCFEMLAPNEAARDAGLRPAGPILLCGRGLDGRAGGGALRCAYRIQPVQLAPTRSSSCPVGRGTLMLNPEGMLTSLLPTNPSVGPRLGMDPVVGRVDPVYGPTIERQKLDAIAGLLDSKQRCARCFCRRTCAGGCHIDQTPPGCSLEYDDRCRATRIITAGRLLRSLEGMAAAKTLAKQPSAMRGVAENPDDRLTAWIGPKGSVRVKPSENVSWFVEMHGVTLSSGDGSVRHSIPYPHAGLWALIANGNYSDGCAIDMMSNLMLVDRPRGRARG